MLKFTHTMFRRFLQHSIRGSCCALLETKPHTNCAREWTRRRRTEAKKIILKPYAKRIKCWAFPLSAEWCIGCASVWFWILVMKCIANERAVFVVCVCIVSHDICKYSLKILGREIATSNTICHQTKQEQTTMGSKTGGKMEINICAKSVSKHDSVR